MTWFIKMCQFEVCCTYVSRTQVSVKRHQFCTGSLLNLTKGIRFNPNVSKSSTNLSLAEICTYAKLRLM